MYWLYLNQTFSMLQQDFLDPRVSYDVRNTMRWKFYFGLFFFEKLQYRLEPFCVLIYLSSWNNFFCQVAKLSWVEFSMTLDQFSWFYDNGCRHSTVYVFYDGSFGYAQFVYFNFVHHLDKSSLLIRCQSETRSCQEQIQF